MPGCSSRSFVCKCGRSIDPARSPGVDHEFDAAECALDRVAGHFNRKRPRTGTSSPLKSKQFLTENENNEGDANFRRVFEHQI